MRYRFPILSPDLPVRPVDLGRRIPHRPQRMGKRLGFNLALGTGSSSLSVDNQLHSVGHVIEVAG
ncbi:MAG: hypothetical protein ABW003_04775 [Microvirga sp.]